MSSPDSIGIQNPNESRIHEIKIKNACVLQRGSTFYYPKTIPQERTPLATNVRIGIMIVLFAGDIITNENKKIIVLALYFLAILMLIGLQILNRLVLILEEIKHLHSRYDHSYVKLLKNAFHFPMKVYIIWILSLMFIVCYILTNDFFTGYQFEFKRIGLLLIPTIYLLNIVLELDESSLNDSLWIAKNNGLDYGSGMAYSFIHGYLNLVLPRTGNQDKNLRELMQDYEDQNHVEFSIYKLFILIPKSLCCFVSLKNEYSPSIDESSSLPQKVLTVAGVQNRVYKNAVYKINSKKTNSKIYVSAEYATPLKTFKEVFNKTGEHSEYYEKHKNDIILQFYLTLKKGLENMQLDQYCELIYYEDCFKNEKGETCYHDVGKIILTRLKELKKHREKTD